MTICNCFSRSRSNVLLFKQSFLNNQETNLERPQFFGQCLLQSLLFSISSLLIISQGVFGLVVQKAVWEQSCFGMVFWATRGTRPNPQDQRSLTMNKLLFNGDFHVCCCQSEDSSAPPLFGINGQLLSTHSSVYSPIQVCLYELTGTRGKFGIQESNTTCFFPLRT